MRDIIDKLNTILKESVEQDNSLFHIGDEFGISFSEDFEIATTIVGFVEDGIVVELDDKAISIMESNGTKFIEGYLEEGVAGPKSCWKGYKKVGTKPGTGKNSGKRVNDCEKIGEDKEVDESGLQYHTGVKKHGKEYMQKAAEAGRKGASQAELGALKDKYSKAYKESDVAEAEYQGRDVPLGKPMAGDVKKSKVYVKNPQGNVVKVNFGDKKMRIKKSNPSRRKSFRARHNCSNPGPRHKARYWSCRAW
jgi:hypothetical protein